MEKYATLRPLAGRKKGDLGEMFLCLAERLQDTPEHGSIRFSIIGKSGQTQWSLALDGQGCRAHQDPIERPDLEIVTQAETWRKIAEGKLSPLVAFARGKLRIRGDETLGQRLLKQLAADGGKTEICS